METIRIIKRKKGSSAVWGILLTLIILGAIAWFVMDRNILNREEFSSNRDTIENEEYRSYSNSRNYRGYDNYREGLERNQVQAYVSFVNREVIPADTINSQTTQQALSHLKMALNEVVENPNIDSRESISSSDTVTVSDSIRRSGNEDKNQYTKSLIDAGNELVDIQKNEYPSLSKMGESVKESLTHLENSKIQKSDDLKDFFILSSSLIQEMDSERVNNQLSTNRRTYEDDKQK